MWIFNLEHKLYSNVPNMTERIYSFIDELIINLDKGIRTVFGDPEPTGRVRPTAGIEETEPLTEVERRVAEGLMRVNHAGEICAQALYQGHALTAHSALVREKMAQSAWEENDHLLWCAERVRELNGHTSYLNPCWYLGSLSIGVFAGLVGDRWSLGFVAETEHQVVRHLDSHLKRLPASDVKSRAIVDQMRKDEAHHATVAIETGAVELPLVVKRCMGSCAKVMTSLAYWV
jgi:3-demethoxyubiquinol 3-hydroxylase